MACMASVTMKAGARKVVTIRAFRALQNTAMAMATRIATTIEPAVLPRAL